MRKWCKKKEIKFFDKRLISLDHVTYIVSLQYPIQEGGAGMGVLVIINNHKIEQFLHWAGEPIMCHWPLNMCRAKCLL